MADDKKPKVQPVVEPVVAPVVAPVVEPVAPVVEPVVVASPLDVALATLKSAVETAESQTDVSVEERFKGIQPSLNSLAEVVKATVVGETHMQTEAMAGIFAKVLGEQLRPITEAIQLVVEKAKPAPIRDDSLIPAPRAFVPAAAFQAQSEKSESSITKLARRSVGLKD